MALIPEIHFFSPDDRACVLPYRIWSVPLLDLLARWKITVFTCEKEVIDRLDGRTPVHFLPPMTRKMKDPKRKKHDPLYRIGLFGEWTNPFDMDAMEGFRRFFGESADESVLVGDPHDEEKIASCGAVFPIQSSPALSPLILHALEKGIPVVLSESSRPFFPDDLPVRYYSPENRGAALEEALSDSGAARDKAWKKAYTTKAVESRLSWMMKESGDAGAASRIPKEEWATFLLLLANAEEANRKIAACEEKLNQAKEAFVACGEGLSSTGMNNFGVCLANLKDAERAEACFRQSGSRLSLFNLANVLFREKRFPAALTALQRFLSLNGDLSGIVLGASSNPEMVRLSAASFGGDSREKFLKAGGLHLMSLVLWELDKRGEALQALKEAIALDPGNPFLLYRLANMYMEKRMVAQPIKVLNEALTLFPFFFGAAYYLSGFYCQVELYDQVVVLAEKYLRYPQSMNPLRNQMLNLLAYVHYMKGNVDTAIDLLKDCLEKEEASIDLENQLAVLYLKKGVNAFESGDLAGASRWAKESLLHDPAQALAVNLMGSISYWKGEFDQALEFFKSAVSLDPKLAVASDNLKEAEASKEVAASLVVLSHNDANQASYCLGLLSQFTDVPHEIIYLRPIGATKWSFLENVPHLREFEGDFSGAAQAYNYGAVVARGKYFVFMEDDVLVGKGWLSPLLDLLERQGAWAVGPVTDFCGNPEQISNFQRKDPVEVSTLDGFCMAVRRQPFKEIGAFDENFRVRGYEDRDLSLRIKLMGGKLLCHPGVNVYHRGLLPVLPSNANISEIDAYNRNVFMQKWESVRSRMESHV